jgi:hypothetical protein
VNDRATDAQPTAVPLAAKQVGDAALAWAWTESETPVIALHVFIDTVHNPILRDALRQAVAAAFLVCIRLKFVRSFSDR